MASTRGDDDCRLKPHPDFVSEQQREARRKSRQRRRARRKAGSSLSSSAESGSSEHVGNTAKKEADSLSEQLPGRIDDGLRISSILMHARSREHVGNTAKKEADSFSEQLPGRIGDKGKSPLGILVEEKDLASYRRDWESSWGGKFGLFREYTCVRAMLFTSRPTPPHAGVKTCLQIFSIRVTKIDDGLEWPLEIYGLVATRDSVDHNRNIIFRRERDACQFLTEQGSLMLTGPSRAVVFTDPVDIEIQLKAKGITEPEDKDLISKVLVYEHDFGSDNSGGASHLVRSTCSSKFCSLELTSALIARAVEATVICAEVIQGRWPKNLGIRVVSGTAGIDEDFILLDARDGRFQVDLADGVIRLSRSIVCVEQDGGLKLCVEVYTRKGDIYERSAVTVLTPKRFSASIGVCKLPFCTVQFTVGWSCLANVDDLRSYGIGSPICW